MDRITEGTQVHNYKISKKIGSGGMGDVYLAQDLELDRPVALKFLTLHYIQDENLKTRFKREAQSAAALNHPNIVNVYGLSEYEGIPYIAMEYIEGSSLENLIKSEKLSTFKIIDVAIQLAEGLKKAHDAGIIHRDIKPSNIIVDSDNRPKILDFGLAAIKGSEKYTKSGELLGTIYYMSPEQLLGDQVDNRSDIFSFGVLLYELLTGRLPFTGDYEPAIQYSIINVSPEPIARFKANVPDHLQIVMDKLLQKNKELRYQHFDDVIADLKLIKENLKTRTSTISEFSRSRPKYKQPKYIFSALLILIILSFAAYEIIKPRPKLELRDDKLAVMYYDCIVDQPDIINICKIFPQLLISSLMSSENLNVLSSQGLYDLCKLVSGNDDAQVNRKNATRVAQKANARWMLIGTVLQNYPQIIVTSELVDVANATTKLTDSRVGESREDIFAIVDSMSVKVKNYLTKSNVQVPKPDTIVKPPLEAFSNYIDGLESYYRMKWPEATESFKHAISYDSTFAQAYYGLALIKQKVNSPEAKIFIEKAEQYSNKLNDLDKCKVKSLRAFIDKDFNSAIENIDKLLKKYPDEKEAYFWLGFIYKRMKNYDKSIENLNKAIALDSLYKQAYNELVYAYNLEGDYEKAIWAANAQISYYPDEPNPYDTRADIYADNGNLSGAIESYKKAVELNPEFYRAIFKLGNMYIFDQQYAAAESSYKKMCRSDIGAVRAEGKTCLAFVLLNQGKFENALNYLNVTISADSIEQTVGQHTANRYFMKAIVFNEINKQEEALKEIENGIKLLDNINPGGPKNGLHFKAIVLAENGDYAQARTVADSLKNRIMAKDTTSMHYYWYTIGSIELAQKKYAQAITDLLEAKNANSNFYVRYMLARAYLESGDLGNAVSEFESLMKKYDYLRLVWGCWSVKMHYYLGQAYERSGWQTKAIQQYEKFLSIWKDADPRIGEIADAKERLSNLKNK